MQLLLLSHNFKEARSERFVTQIRLNQAYLFLGFPAHIQLGLGGQKNFCFPSHMYPQFMPLSYSASLKTTSAVEMSAVFGAPASIQLGWSVHNPRQKKDRPVQFQHYLGRSSFKFSLFIYTQRAFLPMPGCFFRINLWLCRLLTCFTRMLGKTPFMSITTFFLPCTR